MRREIGVRAAPQGALQSRVRMNLRDGTLAGEPEC